MGPLRTEHQIDRGRKDEWMETSKSGRSAAIIQAPAPAPRSMRRATPACAVLVMPDNGLGRGRGLVCR